MIKLGNLSRWQALPKGQVITLPGDDDVRQIRLKVNSPGISSLFTVNDDGEVEFLAAADRLDEIEFYAGGNVRITTDAPDVTVLTSEFEAQYVVIEDAEVFTEIATRAARNPELERLLYLQQVNMERRLQQLAGDMESRVNAAYDAGQRANPGRVEGATTPVDGGKPAEPAPTPVTPAPSAGKGDPAPASGGASV